MSEDADESSKTEEPTDKKLSKAHEEGNWPLSKELAAWMSIASATLILVTYLPSMMEDLRGRLAAYVAKIHEIPMDNNGVGQVLFQVLTDIVATLWLPLLVFMFSGVMATVLQKGWSISWSPLAPKLSKLNPLNGLKNMFSGAAKAVELGKSIGKILVVGVVSYFALKPMIDSIQLFIGIDTMLLLTELDELVYDLLLGVLVITTAIMVADIAWQRYDYNKKMKMTKQEVKDEGKQAEGDPQVKARIRAIRYERARKRMMAAVPTADVVVTNPTHYAVALKYEQGAMGAPVVVAKGVDVVALRIRELAEASDVPIVRNPPLARALYAAVELDEEVPSDHYRAVAEVISYVFKLRQNRGGR